MKEEDAICKAREYYKELHELHTGSLKHILPQLNEKLQNEEQNAKNIALRDIYIRLYLAVSSLLKLDSQTDFQTLVSITRTILELYLDIHLLCRDLIPNGTEKFAEFTKLKKFDIATKRKNWAEKNNYPFTEKFHHRVTYLEECDIGECKKRIKELWGTTLPNHWSGRDIASRATIVGNQAIEYYLLLYDLGNWYVHSGPLNWAGLDKTTADLIAGFSYVSIRIMFADCSQICIKNFNIKLDDH